MSDVEALIAEANSWRNEDPSADSTEQVSEEVTSLIARLADALEFVTDSYVLKSWSGLFEILDEAYPEDVFLTLPDNESRDSGPRIISLIRLLDRERTRAQVAESRLEAVTAPTESEREVLLGVIAEERASVGGGVPVPWSYWAEESRHEMEKAANAILSAGFRLPVVSAPTKDYGTLLEWARETAGPKSSGIHELADAVDDLLSRLPVVPVPVYEYGVRYDDDGTHARFAGTRAEAESKMSVKFGDRVIRRVAQIPAVPASEWELVPVGVDKP